MDVRYFVFCNGMVQEAQSFGLKEKSKRTTSAQARKATAARYLRFVTAALFLVLATAMIFVLTSASNVDAVPATAIKARNVGVGFGPRKLSVAFATVAAFGGGEAIAAEEGDTVTVEVVSIDYEVPEAENGSKRYMDFRAITAPRSRQWELQQSAWTDEYGFRRYGDMYMVAMGTYYSEQCGKVFHIALDNGFEFDVLVSDVKMNAHTDAKNQHRNGNVLEFVVDTSKIPTLAARMGDMSYAFDAMHSTIASIKELPDEHAYAC